MVPGDCGEVSMYDKLTTDPSRALNCNTCFVEEFITAMVCCAFIKTKQQKVAAKERIDFLIITLFLLVNKIKLHKYL